MDQIILDQIKIVEDQIKNLPKDLSTQKRKKLICQWSFQYRKEHPDFSYWGILNSGPAGDTLCMSPIKSQTHLYSFRETVSITCDFKKDKTVFQVTDISKVPFKREYESIISY